MFHQQKPIIMKKLFLFLSMLLAMGLTSACSSDDEELTFPPGTVITQELAWEIVQTKVLKNELDNINAYVSKVPVPPNTVIDAIFTTDQSPKYTSWVFFIDDVPYGNWAHPCRYVYVNVVGGNYMVHQNKWDPKSLDSDYIQLVQKPIDF